MTTRIVEYQICRIFTKIHVSCWNSNILHQNQEYRIPGISNLNKIHFNKDYKNSKYLKADQKQKRILEHQISRISPKIIQVATRRTGSEWVFDQLHVEEGDRLPESAGIKDQENVLI